MAVNKVIYGDNTLIDLTGDTVTAAKMLSGTTAHDKTGAVINGTIGTAYGGEYTPTTEDIVINGQRYLQEDIVIKGELNLVPAHIKKGITLFGVEGTLEEGSSVANDMFIARNTDSSSAFAVNGVIVPPNSEVSIAVPPLNLYQILMTYIIGTTGVSDVEVIHNGANFSAALSHLIYGNMFGLSDVVGGKVFINQDSVISNGDVLEFTIINQ